MWRLKAPEKKPLVKRANQDGENKRPVRRASQKKVNPNIEMGKYEQKVGFSVTNCPFVNPFYRFRATPSQIRMYKCLAMIPSLFVFNITPPPPHTYTLLLLLRLDLLLLYRTMPPLLTQNTHTHFAGRTWNKKMLNIPFYSNLYIIRLWSWFDHLTSTSTTKKSSSKPHSFFLVLHTFTTAKTPKRTYIELLCHTSCLSPNFE